MTDKSFIYIIQADYNGPVKIGYAADPAKRLIAIQHMCAFYFDVVAIIETTSDEVVDDETSLHHIFSDYKLHGEWFQPTKEFCALLNGWIRSNSAFLRNDLLHDIDATLEEICEGWESYRLARRANRADWNFVDYVFET